jgi:hypothetical protein
MVVFLISFHGSNIFCFFVFLQCLPSERCLFLWNGSVAKGFGIYGLEEVTSDRNQALM